MNLKVLSQSASKLVLGWTQVPGARGYEFFVDGTRVSHTMDGTRSSATFGIPDTKVHTFKVEALLAGDAGEFTVNGPPPSPTASGNGSASARWGDIVPRAEISDWAKLDVVVVDLSDPDISKLITSSRVLMYRSAVSCHFQYDSCLPHGQAEANGWLLKDSSGNLLLNDQFSSGADPCHVLDVFNPQTAKALGQACVAWCNQHDLDGIWMDDVVAAWRTLVNAFPPGQDDVSCRAALVAHVRNVAAILRQAGKELVVNANGRIPGDGASDTGANHITFWDSLSGDGKGPTGLTPEYWMQSPINPPQVKLMGAEWYNNWDGWRKLHPWCNQHGVDFMPIQYGAADSAETLFAKASFLLDWTGGKSALISGIQDKADPYGPVWCRKPGVAIGPSTYSNGVWTRNYQFDTAKVNVLTGVTNFSGAEFQPHRFLPVEAGESPSVYPPAPWRHRHVERMRRWAAKQ